jgi:hypothetical protein
VDHLAALQSKAGYSHAGFEHTTVPSWFSKSPLDRSPEVGKSMGPSFGVPWPQPHAAASLQDPMGDPCRLVPGRPQLVR